MMAGNEVPQFNDNAGSISRRLLVFLFNKRVKKGDTQLAKKLKKEIGHILHASNRAY
jgi:phage/plasmid-associated DNA primase